MSERGSTPTRSVPAPRRERKPSRALQTIVECAAISSENLFVASSRKGKRTLLY